MDRAQVNVYMQYLSERGKGVPYALTKFITSPRFTLRGRCMPEEVDACLFYISERSGGVPSQLSSYMTNNILMRVADRYLTDLHSLPGYPEWKVQRGVMSIGHKLPEFVTSTGTGKDVEASFEDDNVKEIVIEARGIVRFAVCAWNMLGINLNPTGTDIDVYSWRKTQIRLVRDTRGSDIVWTYSVAQFANSQEQEITKKTALPLQPIPTVKTQDAVKRRPNGIYIDAIITDGYAEITDVKRVGS